MAEIRRQMSRERESELTGYESARAWNKGAERREFIRRTPLNDTLHGSPPREDYFSMREKRRAEERQYRGQMQRNPEMGEYTSDYGRRRLRWGEDPPDNHQVRFRVDNDLGPYDTRHRTQRWDDEERELIEWAKSQGNLNDGKPRNRAPTPPTYESPRKQESDEGQKSLRSISAPVVAEGIAALGMRDHSRTKQMKQKQYAEELRAQIREKEKAKQREKMEECVVKPSNVQGSNTTDQSKSSPEVISVAPKHTTVRIDEHEERGYREKGHSSRREVFSRRPPQSPSPSRHADRHDRYSPYPPPHGYYPSYDPYHNHPPPWVPPYYHPPYAHPHMEYPLPPPPPNPYYNLQMHIGNPYLPPRRLEPWDDRYERRGRREVERSDIKKPLLEKEENRFLRKSETDDDNEEFTSPLTGRSSHSRNLKQTKASYRAELEKQMLERKERETKKLAEKEKFDLEKAVEIYDPWGKGGCGAPVRDDRGNLVTDLKRMRKLNDERAMGTSPQRPQSTIESGGSLIDSGPTGTSPQKSPYTYDKQNAEEQKKVTQEVYRDFLRQQVEEKEAIKRREKEQKMIEEQKENERLEQERKKLKEDYAREQEAQQRKEEEIRAKNEAIKREAEMKRREALQKQQEETAREELNRSLSERVEQFRPPPRTKSPPIPTLRHKMNQGHPPPLPPSRPVSSNLPEPHSSSPPVPALQHKLTHEQAPPYLLQEPAAPRSSSPPVPALRNKVKLEARPDPPRTPTDTVEERGETIAIAEREQQERRSSDVLRGLSAMRRHLLSEHDKLTKNQSLSHHSHKDDDTTGHTSGDIFNMAMMQKPRKVAPRTKPLQMQRAGPKNSAISSALRDFATLRQHTSQREFLEQFPSPPLSEASFAAQQDALLTHQEQTLARLRNSEKENRPGLLLHNERDNLLTSYSTQVPLNMGNVFSDDPVYSEDQRSQRSQLPRGRRQWRLDSTLHPPPRAPSAGGQSVATLDIDSMARRNEERMRRLDAILNASAGSTQNPRTILDNFLKRTDKSQTFSDMKGGSRQSERSLECETNFHPIPSAHT